MSDRAYAAHETLIAPARAHPEIWRLIAGLILVAVTLFLLNTGLQAILAIAAPDFWQQNFADGATMGGTPAAMLLLLGTFAFLIVAVLFAAHLVQRRAPLAMFGPWPLFRQQFLRVLGALLLLGLAVLILPPYGNGDVPLTANLPPATWVMLLPLSLTGLLIQTGAEELLFRGYLQQQLAARFQNRLVWMGVPTVLFAFGHYLPVEAGPNAWVIAVWSGLFGLLAADITARAGTLGPAIAMHVTNNASALLLVSFPDSLNGLALFTLGTSMADAQAATTWMPIEFGLLFLSWLAARIAIRR